MARYVNRSYTRIKLKNDATMRMYGAWRRGISSRLFLRSSTSGEFKVFGVWFGGWVWGSGIGKGRVRAQQRDNAYSVMTKYNSRYQEREEQKTNGIWYEII
jgi:hypothetical protein